MQYNAITQDIDLGDGRIITIETGKLAKQAHGSVVVTLGKTMILATVVCNHELNPNLDFFPLTLDYREKFASAGKFPGNFFRREGRPTDDEVLVMRLVDRALRPLFPDGFRNETQVMIQLMSSDGIEMPDALAGLAASAALAVSDIPFNGPISEVRVGRINGQFVLNPTFTQLEESDIDMIVAASMDSIVMVEGEMKEISEAEMVQAIDFAHQAIKKQCEGQIKLAAKVEKAQVKREVIIEPIQEEIFDKIKNLAYDKVRTVARGGMSKEARSEALSAIKDEVKALFTEEELEANGKLVSNYFSSIKKDAIRNVMLEEGIRLDGRKTTDIRQIWCEAGYLPGPHGSSLFTRGETQSVTTLTLGTKMDEQMIDGALVSGTAKFLLHYNFPPFSTGEAHPLRGTGRREIGHGNLAMRALKNVLPPVSVCPYTIRVVSDILESNGSSSMATVCAGTLALMDGGVPIKAPVSGIAMGLVTDKKTGKYAILSDILGDEDHLGDMDFKVTGTTNGITACQMDIKIDGLSANQLTEALNQAREGRLHILGEMLKELAQPRADYKPHAPRIVSFEIPSESIGAVIGPGGKIIQEIQKQTGAVISIDEANGKGIVEVSSSNKEAMDAAVARIRNIVFPPQIEIGEIYEGKVKSLMPYGAFVEILPGQDGLLHVSELDWSRVENVSDVLKEGDVIKFKVTGRDPKTGKVKLSRKVLLPKPEHTEK